MYVNYALIRDTYNALHSSFSPSNTQIDDEIEDMFFLYHLQIALNVLGMNAQQISNMDNQFITLAQKCYSTNSIYSVGG